MFIDYWLVKYLATTHYTSTTSYKYLATDIIQDVVSYTKIKTYVIYTLLSYYITVLLYTLINKASYFGPEGGPINEVSLYIDMGVGKTYKNKWDIIFNILHVHITIPCPWLNSGADPGGVLGVKRPPSGIILGKPK